MFSHEEPPEAKRHKRDGTTSTDDFDDASDCYMYRSNHCRYHCPPPTGVVVAFAESWLTDLQPFVRMEKDNNVVDDDDDDYSMNDDLSAIELEYERRRNNPIQQLRLQLSQCKYRLEDYSDKDFRNARRFCNPYEKLDDNHLFLNRSALKLANIDALLDFRLSNQLLLPRHQPTKDPEEEEGISPEGNCIITEPYFVDLCGAPGGFGEYLVWRGATRGYGMSLVGTNENGRGLYWNKELVKLQKTTTPTQKNKKNNYHQSSCCYEIHNGFDGTGDIHNWDNIVSLQKRIQESFSSSSSLYNNTSLTTSVGSWKDDNEEGAQMVLADGGVDAQRNVDHQEQITTKLVVCQTAAGLYLLRKHGTFLIKVFGFQTTVLRALMTFLCDNFVTVHVFKPITSRPASAERYVVAEGYNGTRIRDGPQWISQMLLARPEDVSPQVGAFLDGKEEALLMLNLKACGDILRRLHHLKTTQHHDEIFEDANDDEESALPIYNFKAKWQLL